MDLQLPLHISVHFHFNFPFPSNNTLKPLPKLKLLPRAQNPRPPLLQFHLRHPLTRYIIRSISSSIIRTIRRQNLKYQGGISLSEGTLHRSFRDWISSGDILQSGCDVFSLDSSVEEFQCSERLVEWDFVAGFVDAREGEEAGLFYLAVDYGVGGGDVCVSCARVSWGTNFIGYYFIAEPVAAVPC